jgi:predicted TIM-barrel fold metal-dependent hydrolase
MSTPSQHHDQQGTSMRGAIDVHAHYLPPSYQRGLADANITRPDGFPFIPEWSPESAIELMDQTGMAASLLSVSSPGVFFGDIAATRRLAREVNEEGAEVVRAHRDRFGVMACLPLPDVDASLEELARCYDELEVDGVGLMTNYGGAYLGDDRHEELFSELNRRHATVVLHPTSPPGWEGLALGRPRPMIEFPMDTTRTVFRLILDGVPERYPDIRFVIPHVGSAIMSLVDRVSMFVSLVGPQINQAPVDVIEVLRGFYYDLTGAALPRPLPLLLSVVDTDRLLWGSDTPFTSPAVIASRGEELIAADVLDDQAQEATLRENALQLFPRFARAIR